MGGVFSKFKLAAFQKEREQIEWSTIYNYNNVNDGKYVTFLNLILNNCCKEELKNSGGLGSICI